MAPTRAMSPDHAPIGPIDIVIPHVDGAAPGYEASARQWTGEFVPCQLRDLGELRYVLRSLERHAPWGRVVLVVQSADHLPAWLRRERVRIVLHEDYIPARLLPTFHWATIVAHMHRIPDLADHFLIWEDDVVLSAPLAPTDVFDAEGLPPHPLDAAPIVPGLERWLGTYQLNLARSRALIHRRMPGRPSCFLHPHAPLSVRRSNWREFFDHFVVDPVFAETIARRSRGDERARPTIEPAVIYANWIEIAKRRRSSARRHLDWLAAGIARLAAALPGVARHPPVFAKYAVVNDPVRMRRHMDRLLAERALFMNVNDDAYDPWPGDDGSGRVNPASLRLLDDTLATMFPDPSGYERPAGEDGAATVGPRASD